MQSIAVEIDADNLEPSGVPAGKAWSPIATNESRRREFAFCES